MKLRIDSPGLKMFILTSMVFIGALLLFSMEPIIGRLLTPYFGGAVHVWLTCMMFFQAILFIGYLYAHLIARRIGGWHLLLLTLPLANLPFEIRIIPDPAAPVSLILITLIIRTALPFAVLSTTAVVAQYWFSNSVYTKNHEPYPLYAASNAGSLLALLGYTFIAEPLVGLKMQSSIWTLIYVFYSILVMAAWFALKPKTDWYKHEYRGVKITSDESIPLRLYLKWLVLSCLPSAALLTVTNYIGLEIGSFPLVWIAPLAIYLASFIITFRKDGGVPEFLKILWPEVLLFNLVLFFIGIIHWFAIIGHLLVFLAICIVAHGTLYELRPPSKHLTNFYLTLSLGGWIGGILISLITPHLFTGLYEYPILIVAFGWTFYASQRKALKSFKPGTPFKIFIPRVTVCMSLAALIGLGVRTQFGNETKFLYRNFYGIYRIVDATPFSDRNYKIRELVHGRTMHGAQYLDLGRKLKPLSYYYEGGAISEVFKIKRHPQNIAVIGLGAGAIATYAERGDRLTYYEIDPDNEKIARRWFTYLNDCKGAVKVIVGDGRIAMQENENRGLKYDIILIDAFTGDGIPTHLLTEEALGIYLRQLSDEGVILFHISNRYYELRPIIKALAGFTNLYGAFNNVNVSDFDKQNPYQTPSLTVALSKKSEPLKPLLDKGWKMLGPNDGLPKMDMWTDDYLNILAPIIAAIRQN